MGIFPSTKPWALKAKMSLTEIPYFLLKSSSERELVGPLSRTVPAVSLCKDDSMESSDTLLGTR